MRNCKRFLLLSILTSAMFFWKGVDSRLTADPCYIIYGGDCANFLFFDCNNACTNFGEQCEHTQDILTGSLYKDYYISFSNTNGTDDIYVSDESSVTCVEGYACDCIVNEEYDEDCDCYVATGGSCYPSYKVDEVTFWDVYENGSRCP